LHQQQRRKLATVMAEKTRLAAYGRFLRIAIYRASLRSTA